MRTRAIDDASLATRRIRTMDAARGLAMILVCLSHFSSVYLARHSSGMLSELPLLVGFIASPAFALMSGTMLGILFVLQRATFAALRAKLLDRALFLLTIAHVLIACSRLVYETRAMTALKMTFMTDAIGIALIAGVLLIDRVAAFSRLMIGLAMYLASCELTLSWWPRHALGEFFKELLVGANPTHVLAYSVPILPWLGLYLACTAFGEHIGEAYRVNDTARVERSFFLLGSTATLAGLSLRVFGWVLASPRASLSHHVLAPTIDELFSPTVKLPPEPTYILLFGGLAALLIWAVAVADHGRRAPRVMRWAATLGRSSLAVFVVQFYVYYSVIGPMHLRYSHAWPALFAASLLAISAFASWWDARNLNSILTVGLGSGRPSLRASHARAT